MEQRKLIKLGNSSFAIALPKDWVDKAGLKKGENVFLEENGNGEITVKPKSDEKVNHKETTVNAENKDSEELKRELRMAYVRGYTSLQIRGIKDKENKEVLREIIKSLVGFELVDLGEKEIKAQDFFSMTDANLTNFIRRIDNNIREIFEIVIDEIKKGKISTKKVKEIEEIDQDVNKFYFLCSRIFLRGIDNPSILTTLKTTGISLFNDWWIAFNLESLTDSIKYFFKALQKEENIQKNEELRRIISELYEAYTNCMEAFYKKDIDLAEKSTNLTKEIRENIQKMEKEEPSISALSHDLRKINRQIYQNAKMILYLKY